LRQEYILKEDEILEIKSDRLFHDMFNEHEMDTIEWTVMMILGKSYEEIHGNVKVGNIRLTNMSKDDKEKYVDLLVNLSDKKIIIELNNNYEGSFLRNTLYALNIINNSYIDSGNYYDEKIQGILVNLNWHKLNNKLNYSKKEIVYGYPKEGEENRDYLLKIININLDYYSDKCYNEFDGVDKLSKLLTIKSKSELKDVVSNEKLLDNYYHKMNRLSKDKEYCRMVWDERIDEKLRNIDAYNGGKMEGMEKGKEEIKKEIILSLKENNIPLDVIAKSVKLSVKEVRKIIDEK